MKRIAVLTSGGDAPGMNAAIRAVARMGFARDIEVVGIASGFTGLLQHKFQELTPRAVGNIIHRGGTVLGTSRCPQFFTAEGRACAAAALDQAGIEGLVVIGGDGSFRGAHALLDQWRGRVVGVPGTIDNDVSGTDFTIGFDTAVNTALDATDRIRDTAESTERVFFVEVMGRHCGAIALEVALASGAVAVLIPEVQTDLDRLVQRLREARARGRRSSIVVIAEGHPLGDAGTIARRVAGELPGEHRVAVLGHIQRGGAPTAADRVLGTRLGAAAVEALLAGRNDVMAGQLRGAITFTPLPEAFEGRKSLEISLVDYVFQLAA
jgi:6-phosphofructokinase 1